MVYKFPIAHWMYKRYPTTSVDKLMPRMRYEIHKETIKVKSGPRWRRDILGPDARLKAIAASVTHLVREERIELGYWRGWEIRNYTERLIMDAIRYGDCHRPTMETADFYLLDKSLIHKLFKVLAPRYMNYSESFTKMFVLPIEVENTLKQSGKGVFYDVNQVAVLELKGNPLPPILRPPLKSDQYLTNVLLKAAKRDYYMERQKSSGGAAAATADNTNK
ncbi:39S ribosomal protein L17, mitochondrial-like [Oppia nitens]|uniref:39S ribosomal protein L17, mitochondrial-like n=1 Tax=Oppia nitens TaxID=1686743 RepID=UPI0023DAC008|nr:39S ribosomal protein L17, mitochondrial-like [Oppia nitens]